jgi:two-component system chemotaxis response regulator CheY
MTNTKAQVLLASSQSSVAQLIARMCASVGFTSVEIASTPDQALDAINNVVFDIVLVDENIVADDVNDFLRQLRSSKAGAKSRLVLLTTAMTKAAVCEAADAGVEAVLLKPFSAADLKSRLSNLTHRDRMSRRSRQWGDEGSTYAVVS